MISWANWVFLFCLVLKSGGTGEGKTLTPTIQRFKGSFTATIPINVNNNILFLTSRFLALIILSIHCDPNVLIQDKISIREKVF